MSKATHVRYEKTSALNVAEDFNENRQTFVTMKQFFTAVQKMPCPMTFRLVPFRQRKKFNIDHFQWLISHYKSIWIVRILRHGVVEHCVTIDSEKRLFKESEAMYPLEIYEGIIRLLRVTIQRSSM